MAEELYFFKLNQDLVKTKLIKLIDCENEFSYKNFIFRNSNDFEGAISYQDVINKIKDNIELLSSEEFFSLYNWFNYRIDFLNPNENYDKQIKMCHALMSQCGMELFFEIPSKTPVRQFNRIFGNYICHSKKNLEFKCNADEFANFLKYAICFSGKLLLFLDEHYYEDVHHNNWEIQSRIDEIILNDGKEYHNLSLKDFNYELEYNLETINLLKPIFKFRKKNINKTSIIYPIGFNEVMDRENQLVNLANNYFYLIELKSTINNYTGTIVTLHSV